jgi:hypothetical protein
MIEFARKALGLAQSVHIKLIALSGRGSDRVFFRTTWDKTGSVILIHYDPIRAENEYYGDIAKFLHHIKIPVPALIHHDVHQCLMLFEDLGDVDLWTLRNEPWEIRQSFYKKTLVIVHKLHSFPVDRFPAGQIKLMDAFGPSLYQWERDYFRDNFVEGACEIKLESDFSQELELELSALAEPLHESRRSLVHRDLQSQNVMIQNGDPYLIDFQGMRFGSPFYDLGSLLCDPYVLFSQGERDELLSFYYDLSQRDLDWATFQEHFWEASAQRLMQALGAYGFLGFRKGLTAFLDHIPPGLANLQRAAARIPALTHLRELLDECQKHLGPRKD